MRATKQLKKKQVIWERPVVVRGKKSTEMVSEERDPEKHNQGRPRVRNQSEGSDEGDQDDIVDDDVDDYSEDGEDSEEELEIPDDPAHEARMQILRAENVMLVEESRRQEQELAVMRERTERIREGSAELRREMERLKALRALGKGDEKDATNATDADGSGPTRDFALRKRDHGGNDEDRGQGGGPSSQSMKC